MSLPFIFKNCFLHRKKELGLTLLYLFIIVLLHWRFKISFDIIYFVAGGIMGVYFLDLADMVFKINPSPYRNVFFQAAFVLMTLFVLTSSGSLFGAGLVFSIYLSMITGQWLEIKKSGRIDGWFALIKTPIASASQIAYLCVITIVFALLNFLFV